MFQDPKNTKIIVIFISLITILLFLGVGFYILYQLSNIKKDANEPIVTTSPLYSTNFDNTGEINYWEIIDAPESLNSPSRWQVDNGVLIQGSKIFQKNKPNNGSFLLLKNGENWQDYIINLKFKPTNEGGVGFLIRYVDDQNFYRTIIEKDNNEKFVIKIDKIQNGKINNLYQINGKYLLNEYNQVAITIKNNRIDLILNSEVVTIYGIDKGQIIEKGRFGLIVSDMPNIKFDDIKIDTLSIENTINKNEKKVLGEKNQDNNKIQKLDNEIEKLLKEIGI